MNAKDEMARLAALQRYRIIDTPGEAIYDDIAHLAAEVCKTPIALISLLDESRQWFKSRVGLDVTQTPRDIAFCDHAIRGDELFEVRDAQTDERFCNNPLVTGTPGIRFYAGVPLTTPDGYNLGTLCVIDRCSRELTAEQQSSLEALARQVMLQLELRRSLAEMEQARSMLSKEIERRNQVEAAQRRAERFMRETIDALSDNIAIIDDTGTIVHVNQAWLDFARTNSTGYRTAELCQGANYLQVCDRASARGDEQAGKIAAALRAAFAGHLEPGFSMEYPCHAPGEKRWFIARISEFQDESDNYAVISHQNITVRKLAERKVRDLNQSLEARVRSRTEELARAYASLQASEEKFRTIFENAAVAFATTDPDGRLQEFNAAFLKLSGRSDTELTGKNISEIIYTDDLNRIRALKHQLLASEIPGFVQELRFVRPDGEKLWVHTSVSAIRNAEGRIVQVMALLQNIDTRKQAEYERDQFFELSVDMFVILDFEGCIQRVNPACTRILGYTEPELLGKPYTELFHPDDCRHAKEVLAQLTNTDTRTDPKSIPYLEVRIKIKDGDYRMVRWGAAPWRDAHRIIAVGRDMTTIRENERALRALANQLRGIREEERTRISREIHDELGQMLTALKMDLSLYARDIAANNQRQDQPNSPHELNSMIGLVDEILKSVRRIAQELRPEVLDALGLVPAVKWQVRELQERSGLTIDVETAQNIPLLDVRQSTELFRIIQEALTNVIRHAGATQAGITMTCANDIFSIRIRDNGCGYQPEQVAAPSLGILGMRERAASIGATFDIQGSRDSGTTLTIQMPLTETGKGDSA